MIDKEKTTELLRRLRAILNMHGEWAFVRSLERNQEYQNALLNGSSVSKVRASWNEDLKEKSLTRRQDAALMRYADACTGLLEAFEDHATMFDRRHEFKEHFLDTGIDYLNSVIQDVQKKETTTDDD